MKRYVVYATCAVLGACSGSSEELYESSGEGAYLSDLTLGACYAARFDHDDERIILGPSSDEDIPRPHLTVPEIPCKFDGADNFVFTGTVAEGNQYEILALARGAADNPDMLWALVRDFEKSFTDEVTTEQGITGWIQLPRLAFRPEEEVKNLVSTQAAHFYDQQRAFIALARTNHEKPWTSLWAANGLGAQDTSHRSIGTATVPEGTGGFPLYRCVVTDKGKDARTRDENLVVSQGDEKSSFASYVDWAENTISEAADASVAIVGKARRRAAKTQAYYNANKQVIASVAASVVMVKQGGGAQPVNYYVSDDALRENIPNNLSAFPVAFGAQALETGSLIFKVAPNANSKVDIGAGWVYVSLIHIPEREPQQIAAAAILPPSPVGTEADIPAKDLAVGGWVPAPWIDDKKITNGAECPSDQTVRDGRTARSSVF